MMNNEHFSGLMQQVVESLSDCTAMERKGFFHEYRDSDPIPSAKKLEEIIELLRALFFPGFYGKSSINRSTLQYSVGVNLERLHTLLTQQVLAGLCFTTPSRDADEMCRQQAKADELAATLIGRLPELRRVLETDVEAAYQGDPAAADYGEVISCYPIIKALVNYRVAHELFRLNVPLIPRILTEMAHGETGIDIHPGAQIGEYFTIDHGTGVVIGATAIIGNHVKLYQGVTLGAKSFVLDDDGLPVKGVPRHPIIEDDVIIYSNASILGRIRVGRGAVIGGNVWITDDIPAGAKVVQAGREWAVTGLIEQVQKEQK